jgi:hypothetical protein
MDQLNSYLQTRGTQQKATFYLCALSTALALNINFPFEFDRSVATLFPFESVTDRVTESTNVSFWVANRTCAGTRHFDPLPENLTA